MCSAVHELGEVKQRVVRGGIRQVSGERIGHVLRHGALHEVRARCRDQCRWRSSVHVRQARHVEGQREADAPSEGREGKMHAVCVQMHGAYTVCWMVSDEEDTSEE